MAASESSLSFRNKVHNREGSCYSHQSGPSAPLYNSSSQNVPCSYLAISIHPPVHSLIHCSIHLYIHPPTHLSIHPFNRPSSKTISTLQAFVLAEPTHRRETTWTHSQATTCRYQTKLLQGRDRLWSPCCREGLGDTQLTFPGWILRPGWRLAPAAQTPWSLLLKRLADNSHIGRGSTPGRSGSETGTSHSTQKPIGNPKDTGPGLSPFPPESPTVAALPCKQKTFWLSENVNVIGGA